SFTDPSAAPPATASTGDAGAPTDSGWPQTITSGDNTITVYQPQLEKWERNQLGARAAVSVANKAFPQPRFGVICARPRPEVDKELRTVTVEDFRVTKASFPSAPGKAEEYLDLIRKNIPARTRVISLDRLEANLAVTQAESKVNALPLKNDPPRIIF